MSLFNGRPGANSSSEEFINFTLARYVRIRLMGMHSSVHAENNVQWLVGPQAMEIRSFYSIRVIRINGMCVCSGHAAKCRNIPEDEEDNDDDENVELSEVSSYFKMLFLLED
jgi:laminin, alpha 1/2